MRIFDFDPRQLRRFDLLLTGLVFLTLFAGWLVIWGVFGGQWKDAYYARRQLLFIGIGAVVFLLLCFLDLKTVEWTSWVIYVICLIALLGLALKGENVRGSQGWYNIGKFKVQPAEFAKVFTVLVLASYLGSNRAHLDRVRGLAVPAILVALPALLTILHKDTGTALTFGPILLVMVFMAGVPKRILIGFFVVLSLAVAIALPNLKPYQLQRISHVMGPKLSRPLIVALRHDPDKILSAIDDKRGSGWQTEQTRMALGSGQMFGKGWGKGTQTSMKYLPDAHTDTIFASMGEQFGMFGCLILVGVYALIVWRSARIAIHARDMFCSLMVIGLMTVFVVHIIVNIGMNLDILPVIGIPLPFISYGGSFLIVLCIMFGLIVNVGMRKFIY